MKGHHTFAIFANILGPVEAYEMTTPIDFWYCIGSTYNYLSVMRIAAVEERDNVTFRWRPFDVAAIMVEMNNVPFSIKPAKERYMWRDVERRTTTYGLLWSSVPPYPIKYLSLISRVALIGVSAGLCPHFFKQPIKNGS
jgi:2-hydroxychromene-2-carboxylate isomerase